MQHASGSNGAAFSSLRTLKNRYVAEYEADPTKIKRFPEQLAISSARHVMAYWNPEADPDRTCMPAGQGVGSFQAIKPAGDVLREIASQAEKILRRGIVAHTTA